MKNIPEKIYLQIGFEPDEHDNFNDIEDEEVTWSIGKVFDSDIEYVLNPQNPKPINPNIEQALINLEEYFDDRQDTDHNGENFVPNQEMNLLNDVQVLKNHFELK